MKLTIFESDSGDCLLLEARTGQLMLCDGGMKNSLKTHVRAELVAKAAGRDLDLVYVSHVDNDHINGVLQLLEDEAEWRVFDLHEQDGDPIRPPKVPRPPKIKGILHNGFHAQVKANEQEVANLLAASASSLYATAVPDLIAAADGMQGIALGIREALLVSALIGPKALKIPLNKPPGAVKEAQLLYAGRPGATFRLGAMKLTLVGPTHAELKALGKGWINFIREEKEKIKGIRAELRKRIEDFSTGALAGTPYDLRDWNGIPDVKGVTAPNIASLMFMAEEDGKTVLLTGDAQQDFILAGLERTGFLADAEDDAAFVHLDVLKVQHHGSENNMDAKFARKVSADHYVFCGNGMHTNPDRKTLDFVFDSREGTRAAARALAPAARDRTFHFWFSTTSAVAPQGSERRGVFEAVEDQVADMVARSHGRLKVHYNPGSSITLDV